MAGKVLLEVITPSRIVLSESVEFVVLPGETGELGILHNHMDMIASLKIGILRYGSMGNMKKLFISGGFAEVTQNKRRVLADTAELAEEIDVKRAMAAKERAERRLRARTEQYDFQRAQLALQRAVTRLKASRPQR